MLLHQKWHATPLAVYYCNIHRHVGMNMLTCSGALSGRWLLTTPWSPVQPSRRLASASAWLSGDLRPVAMLLKIVLSLAAPLRSLKAAPRALELHGRCTCTRWGQPPTLRGAVASAELFAWEIFRPHLQQQFQSCLGKCLCAMIHRL